MNLNLTDVTLIVDRSSSMRRIQRSAERGVNAFIERQAAEPGDAVLTLVQFDARYDVVYEQVSIKQVKPFELYLGRGTALLDAMGRTINETHARLSSLPEAERPGLVAFVVVSDGEENASKEFTKGEIRRTVSRQRNDHGWRFTFLGSNQDVAQTSADMGFDPRSSAPWLMERVGEAYMAAADKVARLRRQMQSRQPLDDSFTDDERRRMT